MKEGCKDCTQINFLSRNLEKLEEKVERNFEEIYRKLDNGKEEEKNMLEKLLAIEKKISAFAISIIGTIIGSVLVGVIMFLIFKKP